jgi:hypothetical protein
MIIEVISQVTCGRRVTLCVGRVVTVPQVKCLTGLCWLSLLHVATCITRDGWLIAVYALLYVTCVFPLIMARLWIGCECSLLIRLKRIYNLLCFMLVL